MKAKNLSIIYIFFIFLSFIVGFIFGEDSLGGAKNDYLYHLNYFYKFSNNFYETFYNYGNKIHSILQKLCDYNNNNN